MKLLLVCYDYPSPSLAGSHRVLYSIQYLSEKYGHDMTLIAFRLPRIEYPDLTLYCQVETIDIPFRPGIKSLGAILSSLKNIINRRLSLRNYSYSSEMAQKIESLLESNTFEIILIDHPAMLNYVTGKNIPIILLEAFAIAEITLMHYQQERNWVKKVIRLLHHYTTKNYAQTYKALAMSIAVSSDQRNMVLSHCSDLDIEVIPYGIGTDYFRAVEPETAFPSLIITGQMSGPRNKAAVLYFYNKIYTLIKVQVPQIKLYIVGSNPDREILQLAADESVIVTGYVEDLRPYLSRAWVVVAPLQEGFGVKVRVLQAMAVGKSVVSTSMVMGGIDVLPGENIIVADEPAEFAERVIELLNNRQQRERIGARARLLMETNHSWDKLTDRLNEVIEKAAGKKPHAWRERNSQHAN